MRKRQGTMLQQYLNDSSCSGLASNVTAALTKTYTDWQVSQRLQAIQNFTGYSADNIEFHCGDHADTEYNAGTIAMLSITGILILLCVISEVVEQQEDAVEYSQHSGSLNAGPDSPSSTRSGRTDDTRPLISRGGRKNRKYIPLYRNLLKCFCPSITIGLLLERQQSRNLAGLDGLRSISMMWIIFAHTQLLSLSLGADNQNSETMLRDSLPQEFTLGASLAIDIFFFLSGLLTTYTLLRRMRKSGQNKFPANKFIGLRYLRLTPLYAYILFFYATIAEHLGQGPVWFRLEREAELCRDNWYANLFYFNNFSPVHYHSSCMSWSWYLACDMQYFIAGLLILTVYLKYKVIGLFMCISLVVLGVGWGYYDLIQHTDSQDDYFDKPYTRVTPFAIGILLGILFIDLDWIKKELSWITTSIMMVIALATAGVVVYVDYINFQPTEHPWSQNQNAAYQAFGRLAFALAIAVITFICVAQNKGIVNWFLSLSIWEPLGKLTYGAYLVHPIIIRSYYYQQVMLFHYVPFNQFVVFVAMLVITYAAAAILHILVELPFASLTKYGLRFLGWG